MERTLGKKEDGNMGFTQKEQVVLVCSVGKMVKKTDTSETSSVTRKTNVTGPRAFIEERLKLADGPDSLTKTSTINNSARWSGDVIESTGGQTKVNFLQRDIQSHN